MLVMVVCKILFWGKNADNCLQKSQFYKKSRQPKGSASKQDWQSRPIYDKIHKIEHGYKEDYIA